MSRTLWATWPTNGIDAHAACRKHSPALREGAQTGKKQPPRRRRGLVDRSPRRLHAGSRFGAMTPSHRVRQCAEFARHTGNRKHHSCRTAQNEHLRIRTRSCLNQKISAWLWDNITLPPALAALALARTSDTAGKSLDTQN